jgi:hypothetical protein
MKAGLAGRSELKYAVDHTAVEIQTTGDRRADKFAGPEFGGA